MGLPDLRMQAVHRVWRAGWVNGESWLPAQVHVSWIESGTAVFSFRGTESTQDGLQDLKLIRRNIDFLARSCPGAKAHTGAHVRSVAMQGCSWYAVLERPLWQITHALLVSVCCVRPEQRAACLHDEAI